MKKVVSDVKRRTSSNRKKFYKSYSLHNFRKIPQVQRHLTKEEQFDIEIVGQVLPFKTNNYIVDKLINWSDIRRDPIYHLSFPQKDMLKPDHYNRVAKLLERGGRRREISEVLKNIWLQLNPHPAGQMEYNIPTLEGIKLTGIQHKYHETVLFFPGHSQTCHAYCSFCFRWPQFVGLDEFKFAMKEVELLIRYLRLHPEVTDVLFTGGDPLIMKARILSMYIDPLLDAELPNLQTIRIGSKALAYWPFKFLTDSDAEELLSLFRRVVRSGKHLAIMAHFSHPRELQTAEVKEAIRRLRETGAQIRTQSPLLRHINDDPEIWARMWNEQVRLGCVPYYMFVVRDTGAQHYFAVPLVEAWRIFREAYQRVSGLARTVRGPSMSTTPGKIQILGVTEVQGEKVIALRMIQAQNPDWVHRPFFARYDAEAVWFDELVPAFGEEKFFFQDELTEILAGCN